MLPLLYDLEPRTPHRPPLELMFTHFAVYSAGAQMKMHGCFSYLDESRLSAGDPIFIDGEARARFQTIDKNNARIFFVGRDNVELTALPTKVELYVDIVHRDNLQQPFGAEFRISWDSSYILLVDGVPHFSLFTQKQHAIGLEGPALKAYNASPACAARKAAKLARYRKLVNKANINSAASALMAVTLENINMVRMISHSPVRFTTSQL